MKILRRPFVRIALYAVLFLSFYLFSELFTDEALKICPFERFFGVLCPGCGTTRAFAAVMSGEFAKAFELNPFFVAFILPAALISFLQDTVCALWGLWGKKRLSFVEFCLDCVWGKENE